VVQLAVALLVVELAEAKEVVVGVAIAGSERKYHTGGKRRVNDACFLTNLTTATRSHINIIDRVRLDCEGLCCAAMTGVVILQLESNMIGRILRAFRFCILSLAHASVLSPYPRLSATGQKKEIMRYSYWSIGTRGMSTDTRDFYFLRI
jgi:hypothetical protein